MLNATTRCLVWIHLSFAVWAGVVRAQQANPEDEVIDAIRQLTDIGASDQRRIADWVEFQLENFTGFTALRTRFNEQYGHPNNSPQFQLQLAVQTARIAVTQFAKPDLHPEIAHSLAQLLNDMNRPESLPGLIAGLKSSDAQARYLCAKGLAARKASIAGDKARLDQVVQALREAGLGESSPVVLGRIYEALAYPGQVAAVFDSYVSLFDNRLALRRGQAVIADGAEVHAFGFFRMRGALGALNAEQESQLVRRLAVFLRHDAERYNTPHLEFYEVDKLERLLDGEEAILSELAGKEKGGRIREALSAGGHGNREAVLREAYKWIGDPETKQPGALNESPWDVAIGAP